MAGADGKEARLFSAKQARELWTAQTPMRTGEPKPALAATRANFAAYGLGFQLRDYHGRLLALHSGALQGFYSKVVMVPEEKLGIAILTNAESGGSLNALQWQLLDRLVTRTPRPTGSALSPPSRKRCTPRKRRAWPRKRRARRQVAAVAAAAPTTASTRIRGTASPRTSSTPDLGASRCCRCRARRT
jgi:CubicO group peptidase (beta-lactamase class C family)